MVPTLAWKQVVEAGAAHGTECGGRKLICTTVRPERLFVADMQSDIGERCSETGVIHAVMILYLLLWNHSQRSCNYVCALLPATEVTYGIMVPSLFCISKSRYFAFDCALNMNGPPEIHKQVDALLQSFGISFATMFVHLCLQLRSTSGAHLCERLCVKVSVEVSVCKSVCV